MQASIRKTRTLKVTEVQLTPEALEALASLFKDGRYQHLLDVMERACIELDTALVNASVGDPEEILGAHAVAKAAWKFFTYTQKQVLNAYSNQTLDEPEPEAPSLSDLVQSMEGLDFTKTRGDELG